MEAGPDGTTYNWSISGNGAISQNNGNSVVVTAGSGCSASFTLSVTVTLPTGCFTTCSKTVNVQDTAPPMIAAVPAASTIECPATPIFAGADGDAMRATRPSTLTFADVTTPGTCAG